jgi:mono/diheme cytochrome c family protein
VCGALASGVLAQSVEPPATDAAATSPERLAQIALGQRIYREGLGSRGQPIQALGAGQTALSGPAAACVACHRRSGYGGGEGTFSARPITAAALFEEQSLPVRSPRIKAQLGSRQRPPYDEALLARALAIGLDSAGKPLEPLMPRFALSDEELQAMAAYLATLSLHSAPGVDAEEIHFATVIQPGVSAERQRAMLDVMQAFFRDKGANMRQDESRREAGTMRMYRSYRKWVLHVWELTGPSSGWQAQLDALYRERSVFALLGGVGDAPWAPVHAFSERHEIPAVFANTELPVVPALSEPSGANQYNLYLSRGATLEGEVLASFLSEAKLPGPVVQVYRNGASGPLAAAALRHRLGADQPLQDMVLDGAPDAAFWDKLYASKPAALVLWLDGRDLAAAPAPPESLSVYLASGFLAGKMPDAAFTAAGNVAMVYPSDPPPRHESRMLRSKIWLHNKGLALTHEALQINTLFAVTVASDALGHMMDSFSRDYFIERVEHVVGQTPAPSMYRTLSLGPGQRFAAKGSGILQLGAGGPQKALAAWVVP